MRRIRIINSQQPNPKRVIRKGLVLISFVLFGSLRTAEPVSADALGEISFRDKIYDIAINGNEVFVVGFPGILLYSSDRGSRFSSIEVPTNDALFAVDIAADGTGAIVGRDGLMLTTRDGGKRWTKSDTYTKEHLFSVSVISGGRMWAVGHFGTIVHSADGGKSWTSQTYDSTLPELSEGEGPDERQSDELTAEEENQGAIDEARLNAVTFVDAAKGWIVGEFGLVLHTEDGGRTWKRQRSNVDLLMFAVHAIDGQHVVAVGSEGILIESKDGGNTWKTIDVGSSEHLLDIFRLGEKRYVVGSNGLILVQESITSAFRNVPARIYSWIGSIAFIDPRLGFAAGGRGYIVKTTDGGASWQQLTQKQADSKH